MDALAAECRHWNGPDRPGDEEGDLLDGASAEIFASLSQILREAGDANGRMAAVLRASVGNLGDAPRCRSMVEDMEALSKTADKATKAEEESLGKYLHGQGAQGSAEAGESSAKKQRFCSEKITHSCI